MVFWDSTITTNHQESAYPETRAFLFLPASPAVTNIQVTDVDIQYNRRHPSIPTTMETPLATTMATRTRWQAEEVIPTQAATPHQATQMRPIPIILGTLAAIRRLTPGLLLPLSIRLALHLVMVLAASIHRLAVAIQAISRCHHHMPIHIHSRNLLIL